MRRFGFRDGAVHCTMPFIKIALVVVCERAVGSFSAQTDRTKPGTNFHRVQCGPYCQFTCVLATSVSTWYYRVTVLE